MEDDVEPLLHEYVFPPDAISVVESPMHKTVSPVKITDGPEITVTITLAESVQPFASVTITE